MRSAIVGFAIGVGLLQMQPALPDCLFQGCLVFIAIVLCFFAYRSKHIFLRVFLFASFGIAAGFMWAAVVAHHYLSQELPKEWEDRDVTVIGTIDSLPFRFERGVRFNFYVERAFATDGTVPNVPSKLALSWYSGFHDDEAQVVGDLQPGERWQMTVRLRRPHGNANPYGFDYEAWLLEQNLRATGYVRGNAQPDAANRRLGTFVFSFGNVVERVRGWLRDRIFAGLPNKPYAGVIAALVIGDQRAINQSDWGIFNRTGIGHLISISGLHITMVAGLFSALMLALWRRSFFTQAALPLILPAQKAAALTGAATALIYVLLAGFGLPAQRTLYMLSVVALAMWLGRIASVSHILCIALGVVLVLDPWAVLSPGFWLSFGAVAVILYATVGRARFHTFEEQTRIRRWWQALCSASHTQYVVTLGLVPLTMLLFGQISLVSPLANAVAIPLVSFFVTPLALAGSILPPPVSVWLLNGAHFLVERLAIALRWLSEAPMAVWTAPIPPWWIFLLAFAGVLWMLAPKGWPVRWLGLILCLPLALNTAASPQKNQMWITAFDVGQGSALLIETPTHRLLYDTGPAYSPDSDGGTRVVLPYLKARGIVKMDGVVVSHSDIDHSGGALSIIKDVPVDWVLSSLAMDHPIVRSSPVHRRCEAGQIWVWDEIRFEILHPAPVSYDSTKWKSNARSCTLKITLGKNSILLPGDIEAVQETELVNKDPENLQVSVLLAPHHGSGTSSTPAFLNAVKPQIALFQVGYRNRYRHPKQEIFDRYGELGIQRVRTDVSGAITLHFGETLTMSEYRTDHSRYWYGK